MAIFQNGDRVIMNAPTVDDPDWNSRMDYYVGDTGAVTNVFGDGEKFDYRVIFPTRYDEDGDSIRNYWFCKEEWLCSADGKEVDTTEIDKMFDELVICDLQ